MIVCRWRSDMDEPEIMQQTRSRHRWRVVLWCISMDGERTETTLETHQRCHLAEILPMALDQVTEMLRGIELHTAGFEAYAMPRRRTRS
jgi:hypothetical protein